MSLTRRNLLLAAGAAGITAAGADFANAQAPEQRHSTPEDIGIDSRRLQVAYDLMQQWTTGADAPVPAGAILAGRNGKIIAPRLFGRMAPEADAPRVRDDAMFLMASITKPIVYIGAMMLVERGKLNLSDRVTRYIPEFAANPTNGREETLVEHLFTHTSGLPDELPNNIELRRSHAPLSRFFECCIKDTVTSFKPGTRFSYQTSGTMIVGEIIQRLSGQTINDYVRREICEPLNLRSTALGVTGFPRERLVRVTLPDSQRPEFGWNTDWWRNLGSPGGGLFTTPEDLSVICRLMLNGGRWGNVRLLSPASVRMMTSNRLDDMPDLPEPTRRTQPWGLGWSLNHPGTPGSWGDLLGRHVFGHTGSVGTMVWMDPQTQGFCILFTTLVRARAPWRLVHLSNIVASAFV